jgi:hypothetical protein
MGFSTELAELASRPTCASPSKADVRSLRKIGRDGLKGDQVLQ